MGWPFGNCCLCWWYCLFVFVVWLHVFLGFWCPGFMIGWLFASWGGLWLLDFMCYVCCLKWCCIGRFCLVVILFVFLIKLKWLFTWMFAVLVFIVLTWLTYCSGIVYCEFVSCVDFVGLAVSYCVCCGFWSVYLVFAYLFVFVVACFWLRLFWFVLVVSFGCVIGFSWLFVNV